MTSTGFGWAKYKEQIYEHDIIILSNGKIIPRNEEELKRKFGTMHAVGIEEIQLLAAGSPSVIVIGTGQNGEVKLTSDARQYVLKTGLKVVEGISPKACKYFDTIEGSKSALIHVTC